MCRAVNCKDCGKTTWSGCGQHVDRVMAGVPRNQRCTGHPKPDPVAVKGDSFWRRLVARD